MHLNQLRTLVAVAEAGSLRGAARRLGRSQPALTKTINQIEERIDAELFRRTSRGIVLTEVGQIAVVRAQAVIAEMDRLVDEVNQLTGKRTGQVVIAALPLISSLLVPIALREFRRAWPEIQIVVQQGFSARSMRLLREGQLDFYLGPVSHQHAQSALETERLFSSEMVIVCRKGHPNEHVTSLENLLDQQWLQHGSREGENQFFAGAFDSLGLPRPVPIIQSDTVALTAALLESTDCFAVMNQLGLDFMAKRHDIVRVPIREALPDYEISIVTRAGVPLTPAANALTQTFRHAAAEVH